MGVISDECEVCHPSEARVATHESVHRHSTLAMYAIFHKKRFENLTRCKTMKSKFVNGIVLIKKYLFLRKVGADGVRGGEFGGRSPP